MSAVQAATAANRFGLGATPGEIAASADAQDRLLAQLRPQPQPAVFANLPDSIEYLRREYSYRQARRQRRQSQPAQAQAVADVDKRRRRMLQLPQDADATATATSMQRALRQQQLIEIAARYDLAARTDTPFAERLMRFWSNHFAVSIDKGAARLYAAPMDREAIRPHAFGRFADLLLAVETHPAMLRYLDNDTSIGQNSALAGRVARRNAGKRPGLNENLAREILELHTLGADSGYTQADVGEVARAITGWGVLRPPELGDGAPDSAFVFREGAHEPGARSVLGKRYPQEGLEQGRAILADLALHPATARHLGFKLARHFVSDTPPTSLVERIARAYLDSQGELTAMYRVLVQSPEAWVTGARKFKTPDDYIVSAMRAGGIDLAARPQQLLQLLERLGQPVFTPRSPAGFPDTTADWGGADALWKRVQAAEALAGRVSPERGTPLSLARAALGEAQVAGDFANALLRAGSAKDGYALLFGSPAFQWRA